MLDIISQYIIVFPLVFLAGAVDAIAGGGGLISLPAYLIAGLPPHVAIGTNKLSACMGTSLATFKFARSGYINLKYAIPGILFAIIGSSTGANLTLLFTEEALRMVLLIILPITAVFVFLTKNFDSPKEPLSDRKTMLLCAVIALVIGIYDGFYGPGTGTFLLLLLTAVGHMNVREANGITKSINLTTNYAGLAVLLYNGKVLLLLGILAGLCNIAGAAIGVRFFEAKGGRAVKPIMILVIAIFFIKTILELRG